MQLNAKKIVYHSQSAATSKFKQICISPEVQAFLFFLEIPMHRKEPVSYSISFEASSVPLFTIEAQITLFFNKRQIVPQRGCRLEFTPQVLLVKCIPMSMSAQAMLSEIILDLPPMRGLWTWVGDFQLCQTCQRHPRLHRSLTLKVVYRL